VTQGDQLDDKTDKKETYEQTTENVWGIRINQAPLVDPNSKVSTKPLVVKIT
jgi:hypothetical protein